MERRLLLLLALCAALLILRASGPAALPAAAAAETLVYIDLSAMSLSVYERGERVARFPVAAGAAGTPTPLGVFRVTHRFRTEALTGFGTRFLGLSVKWGQYGIHGTNQPGSIGGNVSHGCVRLYAKDAETLYRLVPNGARVVIERGPYGEIADGLSSLSFGDRGSLVVALQRRLRALGFYQGGFDGVYGEGTRQALRRFKESKGLPAGDAVNGAVWQALGVVRFE